MSTIDSHVPNRISFFLNSPEEPCEKSKVFIHFYSSSDLTNSDAAIDYLKTKSPIPLLLRKRNKDVNTCVEVESLNAPKIIFGVSPPSGSPTEDLNEIIAWFKKCHIEVKLVT